VNETKQPRVIVHKKVKRLFVVCSVAQRLTAKLDDDNFAWLQLLSKELHQPASKCLNNVNSGPLVVV
jgi:hypothetical protein